MINLDEFLDSYVSVWNEADPDKRLAGVTRLWADDGVHCTQNLYCVGHAPIAERISGANASFVATGIHRFEQLGPIDGHHDTARFHWVMRDNGTNTPAGAGFDFIVFDESGRITTDFQYPAPVPAT